jgi:beta-glucanase (GH16 family)
VVLLKKLFAIAVPTSLVAILAATPAGAQSWSDEMNGPASAAPNAGNWGFETGRGPNNDGWGNAELETYTSNTGSASGNSWMENGYLRLMARSGNPPTSARILTKGKKNFGPYGRLESRLRGTSASGYWPALWMLGTNIDTVGWAGCGEIDIMEHGNANANYQGTIHWNNPGWVYYTAANASVAGFDQWHSYGITWDSSAITWYRDNVNVGAANILNSVNSTEEFTRSFYLLANLALGSATTPFTGGQVPSSYPGTFDIDYVRWWDSGKGTLQTANNTRLRAQHSGKCINAAGSASANGTIVQQWGGGTNDDCNGTTAQNWKFAATDSGYYKIMSALNNTQVIEVVGAVTTDQGKLALKTYSGATNQQWKPEQVTNSTMVGGIYYRLINRNSGKCIDVNNWNTANGVQLEQYTCGTTTNQVFAMQ